jgi:hypothetical protein
MCVNEYANKFFTVSKLTRFFVFTGSELPYSGSNHCTGHIKYGDVNGKKPSGELDATTYLENGIILSIFEQQMSIQRMCGHSLVS